MKFDIKLDDKEFKKNFKKFVKITEEQIIKGLTTAGGMLLRDCIMERPTVPIKEGTLRGSGSVVVEGVLKRTSKEFGYEKGNPATIDNRRANARTATVGFNTPYAIRTHEVPMNFTEPSAGNKWMENKLKRYKKDYMKEIVEKIKEGFKKW